MLELAFRPEPFEQSRAGTCSCDACRGRHHEHEYEVDGEFEDEYEAELCPACGGDHSQELESGGELRDIVIDPPATPGYYGQPSSKQNPETTTKRCKTEHKCPILKGLRSVTEVDGVPIEYIGGDDKRKGLIWGKQSKRWLVNESARQRKRTIYILPRTGDGIANFLANMKAVGLPVEALLTMGSLNCRCIGGTDKLSNHSYGDAYDFGGIRLVDGREVLVANAMCDQDHYKVLHRANACLRLSFARVLDYYEVNRWPYDCGRSMPKGHWNHIHCDMAHGKKLRWYRNPKNVNWRYVRVSLGLAVTGGKDEACKQALRAFAGDDVFDSDTKTERALSQLYMREAQRT